MKTQTTTDAHINLLASLGIDCPEAVDASAHAPTFDQALVAWLDKVNAMRLAHNTRHYPNVAFDPCEIDSIGRKNVRIRTRGSVFCFVDIATGNVLKAAGWKSPAKHARGNIFTANLGVSAYGGLYLR